MCWNATDLSEHVSHRLTGEVPVETVVSTMAEFVK